MTHQVTYAQFLESNGIAVGQASTIAEAILNKIDKRQPLLPSEAALTKAFLSRSGASTVTERRLAIAVDGASKPVAQYNLFEAWPSATKSEVARYNLFEAWPSAKNSVSNPKHVVTPPHVIRAIVSIIGTESSK